MSEEATPEKKTGNWFTRFLSNALTAMFFVVFVGLTIMVGQDFLRFVDRHWQVPYLHALVSQPQYQLPLAPKPEYAYVLQASSGAPLSADQDSELFELRRVQAFGGKVFQTVPGTLVNLLVVNKGNANHWLFEGRDRAILSAQSVFAASGEEPKEANPLARFRVAGIAMVIADKDTNKDGEIGAGDRVSLYIYRMDGKQPKKLLEADRIEFMLGSVEDACRVFYQNGSETKVATCTVPEFKLENSTLVADMPKLAPPPAPYPVED